MSELIALDAVVIGGGVVGLAVARALSLAGREVTLLEAAASTGSVTSSRNSEVIHAGLYYPSGALKARAVRRGQGRALRLLREARGVPHRRCGKLVVAATSRQRQPGGKARRPRRGTTASKTACSSRRAP